MELEDVEENMESSGRITLYVTNRKDKTIVEMQNIPRNVSVSFLLEKICAVFNVTRVERSYIQLPPVPSDKPVHGEPERNGVQVRYLGSNSPLGKYLKDLKGSGLEDRIQVDFFTGEDENENEEQLKTKTLEPVKKTNEFEEEDVVPKTVSLELACVSLNQIIVIQEVCIDTKNLTLLTIIANKLSDKLGGKEVKVETLELRLGLNEKTISCGSLMGYSLRDYVNDCFFMKKQYPTKINVGLYINKILLDPGGASAQKKKMMKRRVVNQLPKVSESERQSVARGLKYMGKSITLKVEVISLVPSSNLRRTFMGMKKGGQENNSNKGGRIIIIEDVLINLTNEKLLTLVAQNVGRGDPYHARLLFFRNMKSVSVGAPYTLSDFVDECYSGGMKIPKKISVRFITNTRGGAFLGSIV